MPETCFDTDWMAEMVEERFPDLCDLLSPPTSTAADKGEAASGDYVEEATDVGCRVAGSRLSANERATANQVQSVNAMNVFVPISTTRPSPKWLVRVTSQGNRMFEITGDVWESDSFTLTLECKEIR